MTLSREQLAEQEAWAAAARAADELLARARAAGDVTTSVHAGPGLETDATAVGGLVYLHHAAGDAMAELDRFHRGDLSRYVSTGIQKLDHHLGGGLRRGTMALLGAPTGAGKTTILAQFAHAAGRGPGALLVSPEMSASELAEREIIKRAGYGRRGLAPWARERGVGLAPFAAAKDAMVKEQPRVLILDRTGCSMADVWEAAVQAKKMLGGLGLVALDYAQELADPNTRDPRYRAVGAVGRGAVELARALDCAVLVASQVNQFREGPKGPVQTTFRETSDLERTAAVVLLFEVRWASNEATQQREVASACFKATKMRAGGLFELPVDYTPWLFQVYGKGDGPEGCPRCGRDSCDGC